MTLPDSVRRAIRTFLQAFTGVVIAQAGAILLDVNKGEWVPDVDWLKRLAISATAAGVIAVVTFVHNWSEDHTPMPALLKAPPSSGQNPQPQP